MSLFSQMLNAARDKTLLQTVTLVACPVRYSRQQGQMLLLYPGGRVEGSLIDQSFTDQVAAVVKARVWERPSLLDVTYQGESGYRIFWDRLTPGNKAVVFGGGHVSCYLVEMLALLDYEITVVDDRPDFANRQRFPRAAEIVCQRFDQALLNLIPVVDGHTAVIIVTRGHRYDFECLRAFIRNGAGYLGMIGSRRRVKAVLQQLREEGVPEQLLARVCAPIGLDIGAQTPAEIGVCIAAEVVSTFNGGSGRPMRKGGMIPDGHETDPRDL